MFFFMYIYIYNHMHVYVTGLNCSGPDGPFAGPQQPADGQQLATVLHVGASWRWGWNISTGAAFTVWDNNF